MSQEEGVLSLSPVIAPINRLVVLVLVPVDRGFDFVEAGKNNKAAKLRERSRSHTAVRLRIEQFSKNRRFVGHESGKVSPPVSRSLGGRRLFLATWQPAYARYAINKLSLQIWTSEKEFLRLIILIRSLSSIIIAQHFLSGLQQCSLPYTIMSKWHTSYFETTAPKENVGFERP